MGSEVSDPALRERLKPLEALLAKGLITSEVFEAEKQKLLEESQAVRCTSCGATNPAAADSCFNCGTELRATTPEPVAAGSASLTEMTYAGFWIRLVAFVVNTVLLTPVYLTILFLIGQGLHLIGAGDLFEEALSLLVTLAALLVAAIDMRFIADLGGTPGQLVLGLRVVDASGHRLSRPTTAARYVVFVVGVVALLLGPLWVAWDRRKQGWHDKVTGAFVVRKRVAAAMLSRPG